jgi:hypothetical protein
MKRSSWIALIVFLVFLVVVWWMRAHAATGMPYISLTPTDLKWIDSPRVPGIGNAIIFGDPTKPGPYIVRARYPAGYKLLPHAHSEDRSVTVISGTIYEGHGDTFDESKLRRMPPGSFYTELAGVNHSLWAKGGEVVVEVYGTGPTSLKFAQATGK